MELIRNSVDAMVADAKQGHRDLLRQEANLANRSIKVLISKGMIDAAENTLRTTLLLHGADKKDIDAQIEEFRMAAKRTQAGAGSVMSTLPETQKMGVAHQSGKAAVIKWKESVEKLFGYIRQRNGSKAPTY